MRPLFLVEPHPDTAELVVELLGAAGFEVRPFAGIEQVDGALEEFRPGLLLVTVGPWDHVRATALVRRANELAIPVVLLTTLTGRAWPGAAAVLMKPIEIDALMRTIEAFFES